jgi:hypothetical protein
MTWATLTVEGRMAFRNGIPTLKDLQSAVGGYVDAVACRIAGAPATMWIADEGKLTADPERNWKADVICPLRGDWIAGNVAFTGGVGPEGETLALSDAQAAELRRIDRDVHVIILDKWSPRGVVIG